MNCESKDYYTYPPGTIRVNSQGSVVLASPQDPLYSLISLSANEYWDEPSRTWKPIDVVGSNEFFSSVHESDVLDEKYVRAIEVFMLEEDKTKKDGA